MRGSWPTWPAGAGLVIRNIGLNTELTERAEQLRVSRRRLVEAHDAERHRLERDLHDGAQQQVVALKVKLGIARTLAGREGADRVSLIIDSLAEDTQIAVDEMREVAHGIYPPLLESDGLTAALAALARSAPIPVTVDSASPGRYNRSLEETVYFCVHEAVGKAVDAGAERISIDIAEGTGTLEFRIGSDVPMAELDMVVDRLDALGGAATIAPNGEGSLLNASLPIGAERAETGVVLGKAGSALEPTGGASR